MIMRINPPVYLLRKVLAQILVSGAWHQYLESDNLLVRIFTTVQACARLKISNFKCNRCTKREDTIQDRNSISHTRSSSQIPAVCNCPHVISKTFCEHACQNHMRCALGCSVSPPVLVSPSPCHMLSAGPRVSALWKGTCVFAGEGGTGGGKG